jgi:hypothetical protein
MTESFSYIPRLADEQRREQYAQELAFMLGTPGLTPNHIEGTGDEIMRRDGTIVKKEKQSEDPAAERRLRPNPGESYGQFLARVQRLHTGVAQPSWIMFTGVQQEIAVLAPVRIPPKTYFGEILGK